MTQAELARASGLSKASISNVLNNARRPGPDVCNAIARALHLPPEDVFRAAGLLPPEPQPEKEPGLRLVEQVRSATARQHQLALRSLKTAVTVERLGKSRKWHASEQFQGWVEFDFGMGERLRREL